MNRGEAAFLASPFHSVRPVVNMISPAACEVVETELKAPARRRDWPPDPGPAEWLYLDQDAVLAADGLDMEAAMTAVEAGLCQWELGQCRQPHKLVLRQQENAEAEAAGRCNGLCASLGQPPTHLGMKWIASYPANPARGLPRASALIVLNAPDTGLPLAVLEGALISAMRTGAVSALGARRLAPAPPAIACILGAGVQAHTQMLGLWTAWPRLREIRIWSRNPERAAACAEEGRRRWHAPARSYDSAAAAARDAQIVVTATTASQPLCRAEMIAPGALTIQIAGHECEFEVITQCRKLVVDDWETIVHRGIMTPALMRERGLLDAASVHARLSQILLGQRPGRENSQERIHFAHMGMGICDIAWAAAIYQRARERGLGQRMRLWNKPLWV